MTQGFDRIVIAVPSLERACDAYEQLFGVRPSRLDDAPTDHRAQLVLSNTVLELREEKVTAAQHSALILRDEQAADKASSVDNSLGLFIEKCSGRLTDAARIDASRAARTDIGVDHIVLRTNDAQACIALFRDALGIRLALDKTVPQWGGRMLFFRAGKLTLEVIESQEESDGNYFWGLALKHSQLEDLTAEVQKRGVVCSEVREGRKPGTQVASVKSHCLDIPTLLVQPAAA